MPTPQKIPGRAVLMSFKTARRPFLHAEIHGGRHAQVQGAVFFGRGHNKGSIDTVFEAAAGISSSNIATMPFRDLIQATFTDKGIILGKAFI